MAATGSIAAVSFLMAGDSAGIRINQEQSQCHLSANAKVREVVRARAWGLWAKIGLRPELWYLRNAAARYGAVLRRVQKMLMTKL